METHERWECIKGFPDYSVSDRGRVFSARAKRMLRGYLKRHPSGRPVAVIMTLTKEGTVHYVRLHHLVLMAFKGDCPTGMEGCHNDGNPANNELKNLRWDTHANNMLDQLSHGTKSNPPKHVGDGHPNAKLTMRQIQKIQNTPVKRGAASFLSRKYGVSITHILRIFKGTARLEQQCIPR